MKAFNEILRECGYPKKMVLDKLHLNKMIEEGSEQKTSPFQHKPKKRLIELGVQDKRYYVLHPWGKDETHS